MESDKRGIGKLSDPGEKAGVVTYILYRQLVFILIEEEEEPGARQDLNFR